MKLGITAKWVYGITQVLTFLAILFSALALTVAGWLMLEPREVPDLTRAIEESLNKPKSPYLLSVDKTILALGDFSHPLEVIIRNVVLQTRDKVEVVKIPNLQLSIDVWSLLLGEVKPEKIALLDPSLSIFQDKEGSFYLSAENDKKAIALRDLFSSTSTQDKEGALITENITDLDLVGGELHFSSDLNKLKLDIPSATIALRQSKGVFRGRADLKALQKGEKDALLDVYFTYAPEAMEATIRLDFKELKISTYAEVIPQLEEFKEVDLPLTGMIEAAISLPNSLQRLEVDVRDAGIGTFRYAPYFMRKMTVSNFALKGKYNAAEQHAKLQHFEYSSKKGAKIYIEGEWQQDEQRRMALKGRTEVTGMSKKLLINLWPVGIAMNPRVWIDKSILEAFIPHANIVLNAPIGAFELESLPEEVLAGRIEVQNAEVNYTEGFPHVQKANGLVELTGNTLTATLESGNTLNETKLTGQGKVHISSLVAEDTPIEIDLPLSTTTRDVLDFMKSTPYKLPQTVNLESSTISGNMFGNVHLNILDKPSPAEDDVVFNIEMDVKAFNQPKFYKGLDVSKALGKVKATDKDFSVEATGLLDGQRMQLEATMKKESENYLIKAVMPHDRLENFGIKTAPYIIGDISLNLDWKERYGQGSAFSVKADLAPAEIHLDEIDYFKETGIAATIQAEGKGDASGYQISDFTLNIPSRNDSLSGNVNLSLHGEIKEVNLKKIDFAGTTGQAVYRPITGGHFIRANGEVLDLSYRDKEGVAEQNNPLRALDEALPKSDFKFPALDAEVNFTKVNMSKDGKKSLHDLQFTAQCNTEICRDMNLSLNAGKQTPFKLKIENQKDKRVLAAYTPDAGTLLRNMNLFDDMKGGEMQITGIFQDELPTHPLVGKLIIGSHRVKDVALLTKLLTVATFTGIVDALSGEGLMFQKCEVPFRKENMVILLEDAKSAGPSIGITAEGSIDLNKDKIKLQGVVIPAYMFNAMIRSIPVLGNIFGVLAGEGLVAVNYSMKGDLENPDVSVNPLSALTPGFLRGFFTIFDSDDAEAKQSKKDAKKAIDTLEDDIKAVIVPKPAVLAPAENEAEASEDLQAAPPQKRRRRN